MHEELLFSALADIVNGYSFCKIKGQNAYIKHLDLKSELEASVVYKKFYRQYRESGLPTKEDRLAFLKEEGDWTDADDSYISKNKKYLENLIKTKDKLILRSQIADLEKTIKETREKLEEKMLLKEKLIGATCEKYAEKKKEEVQILRAIFKDEKLTEPFLTEEETEYCESQDLQEIFDQYFLIFKEFSEEELKKMAVSPLFYNFSSLTPKENPASIFGKTVLELTFFQQKLLHFTQNLRYIYENVPNIPEEIRDNYDALVEFSRKEKVSNKMDKSNNGYSIVGADKNDLKMAGVDTAGAVSPFEMLKKSGKKSLSKSDFMKMAGNSV